MIFVFLFFLSLLAFYPICKITKFNMGIIGNGIGAIQCSKTGKNSAPAQYRYLQVFIFQFFNLFLDIKYAYYSTIVMGIFFALSSSYILFNSLISVMLLLLFILFASEYDYTDIYYEIGLFALFMHFAFLNNLPLSMLVLFLASLNKESSLALLIIQPSWILYGLFVWLIPQLLLRLKFGIRQNYIEKAFGNIIVLKQNLELIRIREPNMLVSLSILIPALIFADGMLPFVLAFAIPVSLLGIWREPRIYLPLCLVWIPKVIALA